MKIIEIETLENGAHRNQEVDGTIEVPVGWAVIHPDIEIPESFPFVDLYIVDGTVISMTPKEVPPTPPDPPEPEDDVWSEIAAAIRSGVNSVD